MLQIAEMIGWALVAVIATRVSWHRPEAVIGLALLACSVLTSAAYFGSSVASRLVLEVCQALCVTATARIAFNARPSVWSAMIVFLALADVAVAGAASLALVNGGITLRDAKHLLGWGANAVYAVQCLFVLLPGVLDAVRRVPSGDPRGALDYDGGATHVARNRNPETRR